MVFPYLNHLQTVSRMPQETASALGPTRMCKCWMRGWGDRGMGWFSMIQALLQQDFL